MLLWPNRVTERSERAEEWKSGEVKERRSERAEK